MVITGRAHCYPLDTVYIYILEHNTQFYNIVFVNENTVSP